MKPKTIISLFVAGLFSYFIYSAWAEYIKTPKKVGVHSIDWQHLYTGANYLLIETIDFDDKEAYRTSYYTKSFVGMVINNPSLIYSDEQENTIRVHLKFHDIPFIDLIWGDKTFDHQESIFYIDKSLLPFLHKIKNRYTSTL